MRANRHPIFVGLVLVAFASTSTGSANIGVGLAVAPRTVPPPVSRPVSSAEPSFRPSVAPAAARNPFPRAPTPIAGVPVEDQGSNTEERISKDWVPTKEFVLGFSVQWRDVGPDIALEGLKPSMTHLETRPDGHSRFEEFFMKVPVKPARWVNVIRTTSDGAVVLARTDRFGDVGTNRATSVETLLKADGSRETFQYNYFYDPFDYPRHYFLIVTRRSDGGRPLSTRWEVSRRKPPSQYQIERMLASDDPKTAEIVKREQDFDAVLRKRMITTTFKDGRQTVVARACPLVFDLGGQGIQTSAARTLFDIAGTGRPALVNDLGPGIGLLVFDPGRRGKAGASGLSLFGDRTSLGGAKPDGFIDGFGALKAFVRRAVAERVIDASVLATNKLYAGDLARLEKAYGLGMKIGGMNGRVVSLREAGVMALFLSDEPSGAIRDIDGRGNGLSRRAGAAFVRGDGSRGEYADLWFRYEQTSMRVAAPVSRPLVAPQSAK